VVTKSIGGGISSARTKVRGAGAESPVIETGWRKFVAAHAERASNVR